MLFLILLSIFHASAVSIPLAILTAIELACLSVMFKKFYRHWWLALIPYVNLYTLYRIAGRPGFLGFIPLAILGVSFIPLLGIITIPLTAVLTIAHFLAITDAHCSIARQMKLNKLFGLLTTIFPYICYPILAFSKNEPNLIDNEELQNRLGHLKNK